MRSADPDDVDHRLEALALLAVLACAGAAAPLRAEPLPVAAGPVLSLLEDVPGACAWQRVELGPSGTVQTLATFPGGCLGGAVALAADGRSAVVSFLPERVTELDFGDGSTRAARLSVAERARPDLPARIYAVDVPAQRTSVIPVPAFGELEQVALAADGGIVAFTIERQEPHREAGADYFVVDGERMPMADAVGQPVVVHALRWHGSAWLRQESRASGWDACDAPGIAVLASRRGIAVPSSERLTPHPAGRSVQDPTLLARLKSLAPDVYEWRELEAADPPVYVGEIEPDDFVYATGRVFFARAGELAAAPQLGLTARDVTSLQLSSPWLLITAARSGRFPRVYDLRSSTLLHGSDTARAVTFWPRPEAQVRH